MSKEDLIWRKQHLKNMIWSAKNPQSLFSEKDVPRFEKELKSINKKLKTMGLF